MIPSTRFASRQALRRGSRRSITSIASRRSSLPVASSLRSSWIFRPAASLQYTTESVLKLRSGKAADEQPKVVYDPSRETENCGVGLIASLKSTPSRHVVEVADEMLVRMAHRGGCGFDPASGDGAGELIHVDECWILYWLLPILDNLGVRLCMLLTVRFVVFANSCYCIH